MSWTTARSKEPAWLYALAGALMIGSPIWRELYINYYPLRPELPVLPLVGGLVGALVALGSRLVGGLMGTLVFGALLFVFADLQFDLQQYTYTAVVLAACIALALLLASHRAAISALGVGAFVLASAVRTGSPSQVRIAAAARAPSSGPVLVHLILDEQWGIGGLRAAGDSVTADFLTEFYLDRGFEVFEAAYSRYDFTAQSIPIAFSLGQTPSFNADTRAPLGESYSKSMRRTPYLERLRELGYDLRVYQTTNIDFCTGVDVPVTACDVQSANSIANLGFLEGSWMTRAMWTGLYFLGTRSHVYNRLTRAPIAWRRSGGGGALAAMQRLTSDIGAGHPKATAWFVHVMLPHRPLLMDAECRVLADPSKHIDFEYPEHPSDSLWRVTVGVYAGQVRCTHRMVARMIDAVDSAVGRDNSTIIVHGDHGSRLHPRQPAGDSLAKYTVAELNSRFATLLAIRRPHVAPALHRYPVPMQDALWELARSGFRDPLSGHWQHEIRSNGNASRGFDRPLTPAVMLWVRRAN